MNLKALYSSYKVVHVAQLLKLQAKVGRDIPDKSSPANTELIPSCFSFSVILVTRREFAKTMANLIIFLSLYNSEILADLISQNESTTHSNEGRMSEARYSSVDLWLLLYGKPRSLQNMFFVNFLSLV